jgi:AcrR family transcriptional regulator
LIIMRGQSHVPDSGKPGKATLRSLSSDVPTSLPRGPHALPPDVVIVHQRERLLKAASAALAEVGYAELTVKDMIDCAGVSRRTFYQLYDDKLECVLAAHEDALGRLREVVATACAAEITWADGVAAAVDAGLRFATRNPSETRLLLLATHTVSEPRLMGAALAAHEQFAELLRAGRKQRGGGSPTELTESAVIGSVTAVLGARLSAGQTEGLRNLAPELVQIILAPYLGYEEAQRVAQAAA